MPEVAYKANLVVTYYPVNGRNIGANIEIIDEDSDKLELSFQMPLNREVDVYTLLGTALMGLGELTVDGFQVYEVYKKLTLIMQERYHLEG